MYSSCPTTCSMHLMLNPTKHPPEQTEAQQLAFRARGSPSDPGRS